MGGMVEYALDALTSIDGCGDPEKNSRFFEEHGVAPHPLDHVSGLVTYKLLHEGQDSRFRLAPFHAQLGRGYVLPTQCIVAKCTLVPDECVCVFVCACVCVCLCVCVFAFVCVCVHAHYNPIPYSIKLVICALYSELSICTLCFSHRC